MYSGGKMRFSRGVGSESRFGNTLFGRGSQTLLLPPSVCLDLAPTPVKAEKRSSPEEHSDMKRLHLFKYTFSVEKF